MKVFWWAHGVARCKSFTVPSLLEMGNIHKHVFGKQTFEQWNPLPTKTFQVLRCLYINVLVVCCPLPSLPKENSGHQHGPCVGQQHFKHVFWSQTAAFQSHKGFRGQVKTTCKHLMGQTSPGLRRIRAVQVIQVLFYYIPRAPMNSIFVGQPPQNKALSNQNKVHLGSRYTWWISLLGTHLQLALSDRLGILNPQTSDHVEMIRKWWTHKIVWK